MQRKELSGNFYIAIPVIAMAGATTDREDVVYQFEYDMTLTAAKWIPKAAVTHDGTNYSVLSLRNRTTGAGTALPFTRSYIATDSVAFTAEDMTASGTAADLLVAAGDVLTVQGIHTGTGLIIPAGLIRLAATIR